MIFPGERFDFLSGGLGIFAAEALDPMMDREVTAA